MTKPARVASNGRDARAGFSSSATRPRIAVKPPRMIGWMHGLGAARDHRVGVAALDQLRRLADRVRAGRAGRDDGVVRALDPERDRDLSRRRVDEHVREEARRHAVVAALAQDVVLLADPDDAADRGAEDDPDAVGVEVVEPCVGERLARRAERDQDAALELARLLRRGNGRRVEALDLAGDPDRKLARVEGGDPVDRRSRRRARRARSRGCRAPSGVTPPTPVTATRPMPRA